MRGRREQISDRRQEIRGKLTYKAGAQKGEKQDSHCSEDKQGSSLHRLKQAHYIREQNYLNATEKEALLGACRWLWQALGAQESISLTVSWDLAGGQAQDTPWMMVGGTQLLQDGSQTPPHTLGRLARFTATVIVVMLCTDTDARGEKLQKSWPQAQFSANWSWIQTKTKNKLNITEILEMTKELKAMHLHGLKY